MFVNGRCLVMVLTIPLAVTSFVVVPPSRCAPKPLFMSEPIAEESVGLPPGDEDSNGEMSEAAPELATEADATTANGSLAGEEEEEAEEAEVEVEEAAAEQTPDETASIKRKVQRERHTIFVGNLPFDTSEADIKELFDQHGKVELVKMPRDRNTQQSRGFAFVDMSAPEEVEACVETVDGYELNGRQLRVSKSVSKEDLPKSRRQQSERDGTKKIYCGNLPFTVTKEEVAEFYSEFGEVVNVYIPPNRETGQGRGFAFVTMKEEDTENAIEATNGMDFGGRTLVVNAPLPRGEKAPIRRGKRTKLYVGNLSFYTVPETLEELFGEFGDVFDCYLPEDPATGGSRGFGFVTMGDEDAQRAIDELDGCEVDGREIRVNEAMPKRAVREEQNDDMGDEEFGVISGSWDDMDQ